MSDLTIIGRIIIIALLSLVLFIIYIFFKSDFLIYFWLGILGHQFIDHIIYYYRSNKQSKN